MTPEQVKREAKKLLARIIILQTKATEEYCLFKQLESSKDSIELNNAEQWAYDNIFDHKMGISERIREIEKEIYDLFDQVEKGD